MNDTEKQKLDLDSGIANMSTDELLALAVRLYNQSVQMIADGNANQELIMANEEARQVINAAVAAQKGAGNVH